MPKRDRKIMLEKEKERTFMKKLKERLPKNRRQKRIIKKGAKMKNLKTSF